MTTYMILCSWMPQGICKAMYITGRDIYWIAMSETEMEIIMQLQLRSH